MDYIQIKAKNATSYYVKEDVAVDGKRTSKIIEKPGTAEEIKERFGVSDPKERELGYIAELNRLEKEGNESGK